MLKAKEVSMGGPTMGIEILFKQNKVDYIKGAASFVSPNTISVQLNDGGETAMEAKAIIIATGSEVAPFPGGAIKTDEQQIVCSTGVLSLQKVPEKAVVIGGGIMEMCRSDRCRISQWHRRVGIDEEISCVTTEAAKDGKQDSLEADVLVAVDCRPYIHGLDLRNVEVDSRGRIVIDDQFNTSVPNIECIGDITFGLMLAHKAEEDDIAAVEYIYSGHGHVNYSTIPSIVYTHPEVPHTEDQAKFLVEAETDRILGVHIIEAMLALEYGASAEDIARTRHARPTPSEAFRKAALQVSSGNAIHF
ncbi:hypothetical protein EDB83DRAFT_2316154 [Lactarius deliciosus]|nr:hypothetical protein EDB83DRAFT_2316154 [Lactarius deliciosus]